MNKTKGVMLLAFSWRKTWNGAASVGTVFIYVGLLIVRLTRAWLFSLNVNANVGKIPMYISQSYISL